MSSTIILTILILAALGFLLALVLYFIAETFKVEEDPRIDEVEQVLPSANCGGCGFAGCRAFAESAVKADNLDKHFCPVGGNETMSKVSAILGYSIKNQSVKVAVLRCNGSCEARPKINQYEGLNSCRVKATLYSGDTACLYGCLGCGDCVEVCNFGAMYMDKDTGLPVIDEEKCTACGACVKSCPKLLLELRDKGRRGMKMYVACRSRAKGAEAKKACSNACIACSMCLKTCMHSAIVFENNLSYIDYTKCKLCRECEAMCPTGAIHGVGFPKPLDKDAVKARIAERRKREREKAALQTNT